MNDARLPLLPDCAEPDCRVSARALFGLESEAYVPAFNQTSAQVPAIEPGYVFEPETTRAILAGFSHNRRVLVQGYHGTGKSTHIEQVAARLNWPCLRINLDSEISRLDLLGRDAIVLREGQQVTEFQPGVLPWAMGAPVALVLDEYDAGRPELMFVLQRVLEVDGRLTLLEQNRVIEPHPWFRLFATSNTVGLSQASSLYPGTGVLNQGQLDRWHIVAQLNYLPAATEARIVLGRLPTYDNATGQDTVAGMIRCAGLVRRAFVAGDIATTMSPRTVLGWAENALIFDDVAMAFRLSFLNRCDEADRELIAECYQRALGQELTGW